MEFNYQMEFEDFVESNEELAYQLFEEEYPHCVHKVSDDGYSPTEYPRVIEILLDLYQAEQSKVIQSRSVNRLDHNDYLLDKMCEYA